MLKAVIKGALRSCGVEIQRVATKPAGIPVQLDYSVNPHPRWGHGLPLHPQIASFLGNDRARYAETLTILAQHQSALDAIPIARHPESASTPAWSNRFMEGLDAIALSCLLIDRKPARYMEIGSGNSTMFARHAISHAKGETTITSIDPHPRAEIDALCDRVIRHALEDCDLSLFDQLEAGDVLFYDGSHRVFTNSDATVFFLEVLPRLPGGVLVHIHDIFLPSDYLPEWNSRLYSEQYMLAAMLLSRDPGFEVILPVCFVQTDPDLSAAALRAFDPLLSRSPGMPWHGTSFWIETKAR